MFLSLTKLSNNGMTPACERERRLEASATGLPGRGGLAVQGKEQTLVGRSCVLVGSFTTGYAYALYGLV